MQILAIVYFVFVAISALKFPCFSFYESPVVELPPPTPSKKKKILLTQRRAPWLSWLERPSSTQEVMDSNPIGAWKFILPPIVIF